jgi:hypothetical protein
MVRCTGNAWLKRQSPLCSATNRTLHDAVNNASFSSLKAEADGDLRVGARVASYLSGRASQSGFHCIAGRDEAVRR